MRISRSGVTPAGSRCTTTSRSAWTRRATSFAAVTGERHRARAGGEARLEPRQAQLRQLDLPVGNCLAQTQPSRPFERLRQADGPRHAFAGERARRVAGPFVPDVAVQLRVGER